MKENYLLAVLILERFDIGVPTNFVIFVSCLGDGQGDFKPEGLDINLKILEICIDINNSQVAKR